MSQYAKLLEELDALAAPLAKSMSDDEQDNERIAAAAAEGNPDADDDGENDVTGADIDGAEISEDAEDEDESFGKSFALRLDDGTELEAIDGTALVKSLMSRVESNESAVTDALTKAIGVMSKQGEMIKSLQDQVRALAGQGKGRKAVLSVSEKPTAGTMAKSQGADDGISASEFMAKALSAQAAGRLTGLDVARAESALNKGMPIPQDVVNRVLGQ